MGNSIVEMINLMYQSNTAIGFLFALDMVISKEYIRRVNLKILEKRKIDTEDLNKPMTI